MFFVISGSARADYGHHSIVLSTGDFFGETAVLSAAPYDCTVIARSNMRVLTLSHSDFQELTRKHPKLKRRFEIGQRAQGAEARGARATSGGRPCGGS